MKKTLKTKLIAGTTAVALFSGAGFAFANTSAGDAFQAWYGGQFGKAEDNVYKELKDHVLAKETDVRTYYSTEVGRINSEIEGKRTDQYETSETNMNAKADAHILSMTTKKQDLMDGMDAQFEGLEIEVRGFIDQAALGIKELADEHFKGKSIATGNTESATLQTDLIAAKGAANDKLSDAINDARDEVKRALRSNMNDSIEDLEEYMDGVYDKLKLDVTDIVDEYITTQKDRLLDEATKIENDSTSELDEIVSGINN